MRGNLIEAVRRWKKSEERCLTIHINAVIGSLSKSEKRKQLMAANKERQAAARALFNLLDDFEEPIEWPI